MTIDYSKIYCVGEAFKQGAFRPKVHEYRNMESELLREYHRGQRRPLQPLVLGWAEGSRLMDFTGTTAVLPDVISQRFVDVMSESVATGWSTYSIKLHGKTGERIDGYYGLVVTGTCNEPQYDRSRQETRIGASGKPYKVKIGLFFDEASWDGSDVFTPKNTSFVFVTDKVKRALEKAKISNVTFTALDAFERQW